MLDGLRPRLEAYHGVLITPEALDAAVELSVQYVTTRRLPDKAVDALDEACARVKVPALSQKRVAVESASAAASVTRQDVAQVIAAWMHVPIDGSGVVDPMLLETILRERVIGQDEAVGRVAGVMRRALAGLGDPNRPMGVMLFVGPTGVGKTELAKALAEALFGSSERMIRLDMSEYQEPHSVAKLIGAPPGYVGYGDEGQLTGKLRSSPFTVVLLDEIEKAHPEVFDMFLQLFDEGRITDAAGQTVDARHAICVLTSNLQAGARRRPVGFGPSDGQSQAYDPFVEVRRHFRPEFINRIDELIAFAPLGREHLGQIARKRIAALQERVQRTHDMTLEVTDEALGLLIQAGDDGRSGARELNRVVARLLEEPLSVQILSGQLREHERIVVLRYGDGLRFRSVLETT
jgi:ATP-dependent Clp protease ATP-binding subunit ClpC